jgi:glycogen(starch) synthase
MSRLLVPNRILMTTDTVGGVFDYAAELAGQLSRRGVEVLLATMGSPLSPGQAQILERIDRLKVFESHFKLEWMEDPWRDVDEAGEWLLEIENSTRPELVHSNGYAHGALPWRTPCLVVGHSCVVSWWRAVRGEEAPERLNEYRRRVRRGLRHAAMVVAPSETMLTSLIADYGVPARRRVIYNGRSPIASSHKKEPFVACIGRLWDDAKNISLVDQAAAGLPWPVIVAGNPLLRDGRGDQPDRNLRHAQSVGMLDSQAARALLARASIYAHPARYEPFGLAILEAALAGCALVLGDIPSLRELWGDAAIFVPTDDAAELGRELTALIEDEDRRSAWGTRARMAARRFTARRMGFEYLAAYAELMATPTAISDKENSACA